jgi:hypothetical protein
VEDNDNDTNRRLPPERITTAVSVYREDSAQNLHTEFEEQEEYTDLGLSAARDAARKAFSVIDRTEPQPGQWLTDEEEAAMDDWLMGNFHGTKIAHWRQLLLDLVGPLRYREIAREHLAEQHATKEAEDAERQSQKPD